MMLASSVAHVATERRVNNVSNSSVIHVWKNCLSLAEACVDLLSRFALRPVLAQRSEIERSRNASSLIWS